MIIVSSYSFHFMVEEMGKKNNFNKVISKNIVEMEFEQRQINSRVYMFSHYYSVIVKEICLLLVSNFSVPYDKE